MTTTNDNPQLTEALTDALLATLTPAVAAVFQEEADRFVRPRVADTVRALIAQEPALAEQLPTRNTAAQVQTAIGPAVVALVRRDPGRAYVGDAASEFIGATHAILLNELRDAALEVPRRRKRKANGEAR